jgi:hypothetical protein
MACGVGPSATSHKYEAPSTADEDEAAISCLVTPRRAVYALVLLLCDTLHVEAADLLPVGLLLGIEPLMSLPILLPLVCRGHVVTDPSPPQGVKLGEVELDGVGAVEPNIF